MIFYIFQVLCCTSSCTGMCCELICVQCATCIDLSCAQCQMSDVQWTALYSGQQTAGLSCHELLTVQPMIGQPTPSSPPVHWWWLSQVGGVRLQWGRGKLQLKVSPCSYFKYLVPLKGSSIWGAPHCPQCSAAGQNSHFNETIEFEWMLCSCGQWWLLRLELPGICTRIIVFKNFVPNSQFTFWNLN